MKPPASTTTTKHLDLIGRGFDRTANTRPCRPATADNVATQIEAADGLRYDAEILPISGVRSEMARRRRDLFDRYARKYRP